MSYTKRSAPLDSGVMGWVVTVHFDQLIGGPKAEPDNPPKPTQELRHTIARHWTGWCEAGRLDAMLAELDAGTHCKIVGAAKRQGVGFDVVLIMAGDKNRERHYKRRGAGRRCILCQAHRRLAKAEFRWPARALTLAA